MFKWIALGSMAIVLSLKTLAAPIDTLSLSLNEAERRFLQNNALILAQQFNIEAARAQIIQAKLWDNPSFFLEQTLKSRSVVAGDDRITAFGQRGVQVQQLFLLAGKRNKKVTLENLNVQLNEQNYYDLIRTLQYQLHKAFFTIYYSQQSLKMYAEEIATISRTVGLYKEQLAKGNIPLKEVMRLQSFLFDLEQGQFELTSNVLEQQKVLKVLMNDASSAYLKPVTTSENIEKLSLKGNSFESLYETAIVNRADLKASEMGIEFEKANLSLQKALAHPDIRGGFSYDRAGSYIPNYTALTLGIDLPVFNRNQGNIKTAEYRIKGSEKFRDQAYINVRSELWEAHQKALETDRVYGAVDKQFLTNFDTLLEGVLSNYQKRNLSLIEFIDFYESYKNSVINYNQLLNRRIQTYVELNYYSGKNVFKF